MVWLLSFKLTLDDYGSNLLHDLKIFFYKGIHFIIYVKDYLKEYVHPSTPHAIHVTATALNVDHTDDKASNNSFGCIVKTN